MKVLITGSNGFIGRNLILELRSRGYTDILEFDINTDMKLLNHYLSSCDFIFHLAGVNRSDKPNDFMTTNHDFTQAILNTLEQHNNKAPVLVTSSIQATCINEYGASKKLCEELVFSHGLKMDSTVYIYRLSNVFGKWCRPNYNSVVATFCHNIANNIPIIINDRETVLKLIYIDDLVNEFIHAMEGSPSMSDRFCEVPVSYDATLGQISDLLVSFSRIPDTLLIPNVKNEFIKKLHATYLSYLPTSKFSYPLIMNPDDRGSFTEIIKTSYCGQFSVNILKPYVTKGDHWHNTKNEKFVVLSGSGIIRFRKIGQQDIIEYSVCGNKMEVVDIPVGYTHNIENIGDCDLVTLMWCNECYDPNNTDTIFEKV